MMLAYVNPCAQDTLALHVTSFQVDLLQLLQFCLHLKVFILRERNGSSSCTYLGRHVGFSWLIRSFTSCTYFASAVSIAGFLASWRCLLGRATLCFLFLCFLLYNRYCLHLHNSCFCAWGDVRLCHYREIIKTH